MGSRKFSFPYALVAEPKDDDGAGGDVTVAMTSAHDIEDFARAASAVVFEPSCQVVLERHPLYWYRVRSTKPIRRAELAAALRTLGMDVRYVVSSCRGSVALAPALRFRRCRPARPEAWRVRAEKRVEERRTPGRWFLGSQEGGVAVERPVCGEGAGMRLAVIDDDAAESDALDLDQLVKIQVERAPKGHPHGALMVAWATRIAQPRFQGVAPGASSRLYLIPKPDVDVLSMPLAVVRAVDDGADVVVCATYVDGIHGPLLDDALAFARAVGRRGRGTVVVVPTGREARSAPASIHASFSLSLADPASDPRLLCVGPSSRSGGWFLWRDKRGALRPFANRGPALRLLAPGDDLSYPFFASEPPCHAESSGASAITAGVALLVLRCNPTLKAEELVDVLVRTATPISAEPAAPSGVIADPQDMLPASADPDGHSAKHGYGLVNALRACAAAADPVALGLVLMGETEAASRYLGARAQRRSWRALYSTRAGRHIVRVVLGNPGALHDLKVLLRHVRLISTSSGRGGHPAGALRRQLTLLLRRVREASPPPSFAVERELCALENLCAAEPLSDPARREELEAALELGRICFSPEESVERPLPLSCVG